MARSRQEAQSREAHDRAVHTQSAAQYGSLAGLAVNVEERVHRTLLRGGLNLTVQRCGPYVDTGNTLMKICDGVQLRSHGIIESFDRDSKLGSNLVGMKKCRGRAESAERFLGSESWERF